MTNPAAHTWHRLSPLSGFIFLVRAGRGLTQALPGLLPAYFFFRNSDHGNLLPIAITLVLGFAILFPVLSWYFFQYRLGDSQVQVKSGIIKRKRITLEYGRIQGVNVTQNPIFRLANLFSLQLDTAGSAKEEVTLPGVASTVVEWVRHRSQENTAPVQRQGNSAYLSLTLRQVVIVGLTSNALVFVAVLLAPIFSLSDTIIDRVAQRWLANYSESLAQTLAGFPTLAVVALLAAAAIGIIVFLAAISVLGSVLRYGRFQLHKKPDRVVSTAGLVTRHEQSLRLKKIQTLRIYQNIRQRLLSCFRVTLTQAASEQVGEKGSLTVPYVDRTKAENLLTEIFGLSDWGWAYSNIDSRFVFRTWRNYFAIPVSIGTLLLAWEYGGWAFVGLLLLIPLYGFVRLRYRRWGYAFEDHHGFVRQGLFGIRKTVFELFRAQQVTVAQSPFQRRKGLASLSISLASETVTIPYISYTQARQLQNKILFLAETDPREWI